MKNILLIATGGTIAAREFVHKMEHKLDLLEKFRRAQEEKKHARAAISR